MRIELIEHDENLYVGPTRSGEWIDVSKLAERLHAIEAFGADRQSSLWSIVEGDGGSGVYNIRGKVVFAPDSSSSEIRNDYCSFMDLCWIIGDPKQRDFASFCTGINGALVNEAVRELDWKQRCPERPGGKTVALWDEPFCGDGYARIWSVDAASPNARIVLGPNYAPMAQDIFDVFVGHDVQSDGDGLLYRYSILSDEQRRQIAQNYDLWAEYINPTIDGLQYSWQRMTVDERVAAMKDVFKGADHEN
jgi:hypothetical protein